MSLFKTPMSAPFFLMAPAVAKSISEIFQVAGTKRKSQKIWMLTTSAPPGTGFSGELSSYASQTGENKTLGGRYRVSNPNPFIFQSQKQSPER